MNKTDFKDGGHLGFPIRATFDVQNTPMLPTKIQINWPFIRGEAKNRFSRWPPSWISNRNDFNYF